MYRIDSNTNRIRVDGRDVPVLLNAGDASCRIAILADMLTPAECGQLVGLAAAGMHRSTVCGGDGEHVIDPIRTSDQIFLAREFDPLIARIDDRIAAIIGMPVANGEQLQVLRYRPGQEYRVHSDAFGPEVADSYGVPTSGNRVGTMLVYLSEPESGGATVLPNLQIAIHPRVGMGFWFEYPEGAPWVHDADHAGTPVVAGEKWAATKWFRSRKFVG